MPQREESVDQLIQGMRRRMRTLGGFILDALEWRLRAAEELATIKHQYGLPVRDEEQEELVIEHFRQEAIRRNLNPDVIEAIFQLVIEESVAVQDEVIKEIKLAENSTASG